MLDLKTLEKNPVNEETGLSFIDEYKRSLKGRGLKEQIVDEILELNSQRKAAITEFEAVKSEQNKVGQEIAALKRSGGDAVSQLKQMQEVAKKAKNLEKQSDDINEKLNNYLQNLPNKIHHTVPIGESEEENQEIRTHGSNPNFSFTPIEHWELGEKLGLIDFERAGKVAGSRFAFLKGSIARLERALIQFMTDTQVEEHGYTEIIPPYIVNTGSLFGTGQFPKFMDDVFHIKGADLFLSPTAEVPLANYYSGEILDGAELPKRFAAFAPCFRSEAGSYGKDTKGIFRNHQFHKIELVVICHPSESYKFHEQMTEHAERILQKLNIHYRTVILCSGDIGFSAAKCYDIEVWLPGQNKFREISSVSNCEDFQARRANIRFRPGAKDKPQFVHTLNGSGLAVGRTLIAIMENYQQEDGSIEVPEVLRPFMGGLEKITALKS